MQKARKPAYSFKSFILTVAIPIVAFWTVIFFAQYPLPTIDDLFFIGAAMNLAKGGEFTNPYIAAWNSILSSGKFYFQPPFHSYTLAGWLKIAGISTTSFLLFQYLCYNTFSLSSALILRNYGFSRSTSLCTTFLIAVWHCNPNIHVSTGLRQDALGMAYLGLGLWLLTRDSWWRYFLGFSFAGSAICTSPITAAYAIPFTISILIINLIHSKNSDNLQYLLTRSVALLAACGLVFMFFLLCINFDLYSFLSDFSLHASLRRTSAIKSFPVFIWLITRAYGKILILPSYILFISLAVGVFINRYCIYIEHKILLIALSMGMILNVLLYASAVGFAFFFCWLGIIIIIFKIKKLKIKLYAFVLTGCVFLSSQFLNILSLAQREYVPENQYREIKEAVLANPDRKYAIDDVAARFVFDYKLPKNCTSWTFMHEVPGAAPIISKDKPSNVTWIVATPMLGGGFPHMLKTDFPRVKFLGHRFNSLPKKPFELTVVP